MIRHQLRRAFWSCTAELGRVPADGSSCRVDRRGGTLKGRLLAAVLAVSGRAVFYGDLQETLAALDRGYRRPSEERGAAAGACPPRSPYDEGRGYAGMTLDEVARLAGVGKSSLCPGFPTDRIDAFDLERHVTSRT